MIPRERENTRLNLSGAQARAPVVTRRGAQIYGALMIFLWTFIVSLIFWSIIKMFFGLRVTEEEETDGVDISECGLEAYPEFSKASGAKPSVYPEQ